MATLKCRDEPIFWEVHVLSERYCYSLVLVIAYPVSVDCFMVLFLSFLFLLVIGSVEVWFRRKCVEDRH